MSPHKHDASLKALDLSHHLNTRSKGRHRSPLKDILRFMTVNDMVSLAGGLPHPSLFPIYSATVFISNPSKTGEMKLSLSNELTDNPLSRFLQYGLRQWCEEFTRKVHKPLYDDFETLLHTGNTNAWSKVVGLLCEEGDYILCESHIYPSAQAYWISQGNLAAPVGLDEEGIRDDALEEILENWEATHPGVNRPHVLYLVSVGSNPTGVTMGTERRQKIYEICVKFDVIIVEDDPYFFLQYPEYNLGENVEGQVISNDKFLASMVPSFLRFDYQGRVIRLESFSKTLAPGLRLGYFVANSIFTERLLRASEVETQDPSGMSQALVYGLVHQWGTDGYLIWLQNLRIEYQTRRDWIIKAFAQQFTLKPAAEVPAISTSQGMVALIESVPIFSFVPPTGGMFIWTAFYLGQNPNSNKIRLDSTIEDPEQLFGHTLWETRVEELVLLTPGSYYYPWQGKDKVSTKARGTEPEIVNFRFSFSMATMEAMELGISRLAKVVKSSWELE
ncbi:PLP-dependent transferase [Penicillium angulare]|uniref:PLP-dependent transferase n=1 Tax=Penicillium angulare TaxID=116970 RepID=UPI00253F7CD0|nr:PLP-dependent transferase [Penicillium angulare]KAJ5272455.1 PLP-dependent transferase [Penicillium angulare]